MNGWDHRFSTSDNESVSRVAFANANQKIEGKITLRSTCITTHKCFILQYAKLENWQSENILQNRRWDIHSNTRNNRLLETLKCYICPMRYVMSWSNSMTWKAWLLHDCVAFTVPGGMCDHDADNSLMRHLDSISLIVRMSELEILQKSNPLYSIFNYWVTTKCCTCCDSNAVVTSGILCGMSHLNLSNCQLSFVPS